jgi:hypothetical protein
MFNIPSELLTSFVTFLEKQAVPSALHNDYKNDYKKWLRYYLDYSTKYGFPDGGSKSLTQFLGKLRQKKQTEDQIRQAGHAVTLYQDLKRLSKKTPPLIWTGITESTVREDQNLALSSSLPSS